jgi:mono/diheme cytochrome c family protein
MLLVGLLALPACVDRSEDPVTGAALYQRHCASCHGADGRGEGPVAATLRTPPTDLTRLAQASSGRFDETAVMMAIDGRRSVAEHGPREMPVWGAVFQAEHVGEPLAIYGPVRDARALADYLRGIQVEASAAAPGDEPRESAAPPS